MTTPIEIGVALGIELLKWAINERDLRQKMAAAGVSGAAIDAALAKARADVAALPSATTLPEA